MCWPIGSLVDLGYPRTFFGNSRGRIIGPQLEKICLRGAGEQQRGRPACAFTQSDQLLCYSLIGKYYKYRLATSEISIYYQVSVAEQAGLNFTLSETPKTGSLASRPN